MKKKSAQQILVEWITDPNIPEHAWQTFTFDQMEQSTGISKGYLNRILIKVVAQTLQLDYDTAKQMRDNARAGERGMPISDELVAKINRLLKQKNRAAVAAELGISYSTVVRYNKTKRKRKKNDSLSFSGKSNS